MRKLSIVIKKNWYLFLIILLSAFLRLYKISSYMTFLGDEGRDALVWLRMVRNHKFTLIGPQTSIGNMYLGPLYYYLMLPFYILLGTVGPSIGVALFGGATTFLLWFCGREWFSEKVGLLAAFFYAISPVGVVLSRSSWNPNVIPFFALLAIYGIYQFWQKDKFEWLPTIGVTLSFAIQSHYLGVLLIPVAGIFFLAKLIELLRKKDKKTRSFLLLFTVSCLLFTLLTIIPLIWFDLRHNFINYKAFYKFFSERQTTVNFKIYKAFPNLWPLWQMMITRLLAGKNETFGFWLSIALLLLMAFWFIRYLRGGRMDSSKVNSRGIFLVLVWLGIGLLGMGLYKQHIYDHYFGFLFPAVFLLVSYFSLTYSDRHVLKRYLGWGLVLVITIFSLLENPLRYQPNYQMKKVKEIDKKVIAETQNKPYNFALIAKQNYEAGYEYFLELWGKPPIQIDPQRLNQTITEQLFVACEDPVCEPTTNSKAGIANFGWSKIEQEWEFPWGVRLFKLVHVTK